MHSKIRTSTSEGRKRPEIRRPNIARTIGFAPPRKWVNNARWTSSLSLLIPCLLLADLPNTAWAKFGIRIPDFFRASDVRSRKLISTYSLSSLI